MKNKRIKLIILITSALLLMLVLSGCSANMYRTGQKPPTNFFYGTFYKYLAVPMQQLINWTAKQIGGPSGYGWGILIITFLVRLIILPLMLSQSKKSTMQQEKVKRIQPQLTLIQKAMKTNKNPDAQSKLGQLQMDVYKKNNLSLTGGIGCLPLIIQFPIMIGIYQAVMYSPEISSARFLGISLGRPNWIVVFVSTALYLIVSYISLIGVPQEQKRAMQTSALLNPIMTFFISVFAPAGLGLYFLVGGIIFLIQQCIVTFYMTPRIKRQVDKELEENPVVEVVTEDTIQNLNSTPAASESGNTAIASSASLNQIHELNRKRNAGKQKHH